MSKLFVFIILAFTLYYTKRYKSSIWPSSNGVVGPREKESFLFYKKPSVIEYFDIISNPNNATIYKKMDLDQNNALTCMQTVLNILKRQSKFISFNIYNKPHIGIFACQTKQLSRILDITQHTQQDFLDSNLPNGVFLFYLMVRHNKNVNVRSSPVDTNSKETKYFKLLFKDLLDEIILQCKGGTIFPSSNTTDSHIQYILYPVQNYNINNPIVQVLFESGFIKLNYRFDRIVFFKKYITYS